MSSSTLSLSLLRLTPPLPRRRSAALRSTITARSSSPSPRFPQRTTVPAADRLISALSYSLPFLNSLHYGRFIFARFPPAAAALAPVLPLASAYRSLPYASFVAFFALYLGVVRNPNLSRYVRFNSMQAVVLDVLLALPTLFQRILGVPSHGVGLRVLEFGYTFIFLFAAGCFVYGVFSSVLGRTPHLPIVAAAADRQL